MGPEFLSSHDALQTNRNPDQVASHPTTADGQAPALRLETSASYDPNRVFFGASGLRAGWSLLVFGSLLYFFSPICGTILSVLVYDVGHLTIHARSPLSTIFGEAQWLAALLLAALIVSRLERRRLSDYNLAGPKRLALFLGGAAAGFIAISVLVATLSKGGWMQVGPAALAGTQILKYAALWAIGFALVGLFEEGAFRCYLLYTFTRGVNFWWALASIAPLCLYLLLTSKGQGAWGIYIAALAGLFPCLWLEWNKAPQSGFWQAAWVTSVGFGFIHTFNNGENWIGVLAAAGIGLVFCVSVRLTGSAWWAIGCHASWDWAESYFYGTADSGFAARGHLLTSTPVGSSLWSGGADGPEGSVLVFPIMLLLLAALLLFYGRRKRLLVNQPASETVAGQASV
jgi:membrane protease YdiL (CAAX protease family)